MKDIGVLVNLLVNIQMLVKQINEKLYQYLMEIGHRDQMNDKYTTLFALLQIHGPLTQADFKTLTGFSLSTISTSLNALIEMGVIIRKKNLENRNYYYKLTFPDFKFIYMPFGQIVERLDVLDRYFVSNLALLKKDQSLPKDQVDFFTNRINSLRNYAEIQRRTINNEKKFEYLSEIIDLNPYNNNYIEYVPKIQEIEESIINRITNSQIIMGSDAVLDRIFGYFITRGVLTQDILIELTGYSRAMISRKLKQARKWNLISTFPKKYHKSRNYYFQSFSLSSTQRVLDIDTYIFSKVPEFLNDLQQVEEKKESKAIKKSESQGIEQLVSVLRNYKESVEEFRGDSANLEKNRNDLLNFLKKKNKTIEIA